VQYLDFKEKCAVTTRVLAICTHFVAVQPIDNIEL
jgi:hypothetical protein